MTVKSRTTLRALLGALVLGLLITAVVLAATGDISTVAGTGVAGFNGDGIAATAQVKSPLGVAVDSAGNIFIADSSNNRVRKIDTSGNISTVAGTGTGPFNGDGIAATSANIGLPSGIAIDSAGNIFIADTDNDRIRKVDTSGNISTVAGNGTPGFSGDGSAATSAQLNFPWASRSIPRVISSSVTRITTASARWTRRATSAPWRARGQTGSTATGSRRPAPI